MLRPESAAPPASSTAIERVEEAPGCTTTESADKTTRLAGTGVTLTVAVPDFPSLRAVMTAVAALPPRFCPAVTIPAGLTFATEISELDHAKTRASSGLPFASSATAVSDEVEPLASVSAPGLTETLFIGAGPVGPSEHDEKTITAASAGRTGREQDRIVMSVNLPLDVSLNRRTALLH